ncbi:MAG: hypothetical protein PVJ34_10100 [Anaerolineae bacterium]|jgi:uncharacterized membrane protein YagU involved in acid resistance
MVDEDLIRGGLIPGALAGLVGGLILGATMPTIASLVQAESALVGLVLHLVAAAIIGAGFGLLVWRQRFHAGEMLFWGLAYGTLWWFLGPLTLLPLLLGQGLAWDLASAQATFPSLLGHMLYGAGTGLAFSLIKRARRPAPGALLRGVLAGLLAAWFLGKMLAAQGQLLTLSAVMGAESMAFAWLAALLLGLLAGLAYAALYPRPFDSAGAGLTRGMVYGFFWWVAGGLSLLPLLSGAGLTWSLAAARQAFATLPGYLLFGAALALLYQWLDGLVRLLFSDTIGRDGAESIGTQGLRALGRGALAGLVGGLIFTLVMVQLGVLPAVASLIGATSSLTGLVVHLVISNLIGASYGLLFRHQSYDLPSALGWGVSYGFFWWILGFLTLMPILLGTTPRWTVEVAAGSFPSLVGHLAYGAGLALVYYRLEARYNPWWISHTQAEAEHVARRKEQVRTSAPALWVLVVVLALTVPVILGM